MSKINSVAPLDNYCIEVKLDNGSSLILDLKSRLKTIRFGILENKELFSRVTTNGNCISWDDKIEISISELFQLAQK